MNTPTLAPAGLPIAAVERDTGLAKDTLRVWERRYGFPLPVRDSHGERVYSPEQVDKLRLIRRLIDQGLRPAKLIGLDPQALGQMLDELGGPRADDDPERTAHFQAILKFVRLHLHEDLRRTLQQSLMKTGLQQFVTGVVAPLNHVVGDAWLRGELEVAEEHLYTEQVQNILRTAISTQTSTTRERPIVMLTTFPDEQHALGLLMVEAMIAPEGACCVSLGIQTPLEDIRAAATAGRFDIIAVSFSGAYPARLAIEGLRSLRTALPETIALWAGGAGLRGAERKLPGVKVFKTLEEVPAALHAWRRDAEATLQP
ncbi:MULTISPECIES: MerR family transcriptional regulator [Zoogloea]|jgi:DNA-binding transcriptional MerR regulator/methylmalonyl-CoA mutase cobalamin-binding subunit|uniref:MerR family transcriptional regulator n=1 Tax=Zoogloea oleivorans TaxID=1552750 RepID=A0A6C2CM31_9RHOO|nr:MULTISPECIES: MerR family transcriptional regulator [Zoogloea]MBT9496120.1 MerR family transcriptional regulator [Zoogloea sp.]MDD2669946.1 MerR family transcriptional regulator [Zoogloea sp.]MDY0035962.1 MerR family transcriptional regulator [Zoogloea oleivorans]TYC55031.1 MerR family transcriptional regulator [Zoogloea oleivorans]